MSKTFDDMPDGAGKRATEEDYKRIWLYMESRNRHPSVRSVLTEIQAQNFLPPSVATSSRWSRKLGLSHTPAESPTKDADKRQRDERHSRKIAAPVTVEQVAAKADKPPEQVERTLKSRMEQLLKTENSSTQLAIDENRTRMAFNIALMEFYADTPGLLANLRDTAALIDAVTIASKLSGGASIDITLPGRGEEQDDVSPSGHPMKTVSPLTKLDQGLVTSFNDFKARLRDGERA